VFDYPHFPNIQSCLQTSTIEPLTQHSSFEHLRYPHALLYDNIALLLRLTRPDIQGRLYQRGFRGKSAHMSNLFHTCVLYGRKDSCFTQIFFIIRPGIPCRHSQCDESFTRVDLRVVDSGWERVSAGNIDKLGRIMTFLPACSVSKLHAGTL